MRVINKIEEFREIRNSLGPDVGSVLTMGAIHAGHVALISQSVAENAHTICSIFVNPKQFPHSKDFDSYPRSLESDLSKMDSAGVDIVFAPSEDEMYDKDTSVNISFPKLAGIYEGKDRPGHFDGVGMIVIKLLNILKPKRTYLGQKDFQQLVLIKSLVRDLSIDVEIIECETIREFNGVAVSSRNSLLSSEGMGYASVLSVTLLEASASRAAGVSLRKIEADAISFLEQTRGVDKVHYLSFVDQETLNTVDDNHGPCVLLAAVTIAGVRLIDNLVLD